MLKQFRATVPFFSQMVYETYDRLLVCVTLEKREGACALFVQKTPDMCPWRLKKQKNLKLYIHVALTWLSYFLCSALLFFFNAGVCSTLLQTPQEELRKSLINVAWTEGMDDLETDVEWIPKKLKLMHYIRFSLLVKRQAFFLGILSDVNQAVPNHLADESQTR